MSKQSYTPGPWRLIHNKKKWNLHAWIFGKDPGTDVDREVEVIKISDYHPIGDHHERRLADMKLMAAAPEMYEFLNGIVNGNFPDHKYVQELLDKING